MKERTLWKQFSKNRIGVAALVILSIFVLLALYAPFLASSKPLLIRFEGTYYFPLLRYLFYPGFYTKPIDLFFNSLMLTIPLALIGCVMLKKHKKSVLCCMLALQIAFFLIVKGGVVKDPACVRDKQMIRQETLSWDIELKRMNTYQKINLLLSYKHKKSVEDNPFVKQRNQWLENENEHFQILLGPLLRPFHWEEDAGGGQAENALLPWWEITRINRKDLSASLLFGIRISLVVGVTAVLLALLIGVPLGAFSGYFAGKLDIFLFRFIEIWEAMPAFFMLLLIVAIAQSKSIFLVICVLGLFGWTHFARFIRGEVLRQRSFTYVLAQRSLGFKNRHILFSHILPNAIFPVLTLLPFSMMAAITSEAGLSFLGLGEEGSTSWGVLMAEARSVFPAESYLLWPPALLLTLFLVSIALVGDALRDALDPKMNR